MDKSSKIINIIGGGLSGCESALQFANAGWKVNLYEMRPKSFTPAHHTDKLAELVCSNSLKSELIGTASGLLKKELETFDCQLLKAAETCKVPAGNALAVDRNLFAEKITQLITNHSNICLIREEVKCLNKFKEKTIIATGPLSSESLIKSLQSFIPDKNLYFFDAIAPIIDAESINMNRVFFKSRYDKSDSDYINCPFNKKDYYTFVEALTNGEKYQLRDFEKDLINLHNYEKKDFIFYENCTPIEELARRGKDTLRFGVLRPVGLEYPDTFGDLEEEKKFKKPFAVLQLRCEDSFKNSYNLVGCQTMLRQKEQKKIFRLIPGLEEAKFIRYGSIHRNTYINSPLSLNFDLSLKSNNLYHVIGQLSGLEGYVEAIFSGILIFLIICKSVNSLPETTIMGQLWNHLQNKTKNFQPMNANFGLLPPVTLNKISKKDKKTMLSKRSLNDLSLFNFSIS